LFVILANFESLFVQIVPRHFQPGFSRESGLTRTSALILTSLSILQAHLLYLDSPTEETPAKFTDHPFDQP
jgi:hypothetical protein